MDLPSRLAAVPLSAEARAARTLRRLLIVAVALGFAVLVAVSATTLVLVSRDQDSTRWVNHTYQAVREISDLRVEFERTETARRGYLITRDASYIHTNATAAIKATQLVGQLRRLTADNPVERRNTASLAVLLRQKLDEQAASLGMAETDPGGRLDPAGLIRQDQGLVDRVRHLLGGMEAEEHRLLILRTQAQADGAETLLGVVLASGVLLAVIAATSFLLMRRYAADLGRSQSDLRRLNEGLEAAVRTRTADLTRANEEIQRFAYIVSHDLRSPLVNVMGFTSELEVALKALHKLVERAQAEAPHLLSAEARMAVEQDLPESIGFIRSSTQKMDRLINAILKLSREGRRSLTPEPLEMTALMTALAGTLKHQADARGAEIVVEGPLPALVGDRLALEQIFSNLLENGLKYLSRSRPGRIVARGRDAGSFVVYEIQDNGRGIDPRDHERVFELFRRAGPQDQPGEGIGLAHVRALITRLGGAITVDSQLDQGATFRVSLPRTLHRSEEAA